MQAGRLVYLDWTHVSESADTGRSGRIAWLRILVVVAFAVVLVNVVAITAVTLLPGRCVSCHDSSLEVRETHATVQCLDCHGGSTVVERVDFAGRQVYGMYLKMPVIDDRSAAAVSDVACVSCHAAQGGPSETAIRIDHVTCAVDRSCTDCHSRVAHGDSVSWPREYDMFDCVACHMEQATSVECDLCHTQRSREERVRTGTFALTHAASWRDTHGMGDPLACAACHPSDKCIDCHGPGVPHQAAFARSHGEYAVEKGAQCTSCHTQRFCDDCHGLEMPHPADFAPAHSTLVEEQGRETCETCHAPSDCTTCHVKHVHPGNARPPGGG